MNGCGGWDESTGKLSKSVSKVLRKTPVKGTPFATRMGPGTFT